MRQKIGFRRGIGRRLGIGLESEKEIIRQGDDLNEWRGARGIFAGLSCDETSEIKHASTSTID